MLVSDSPPIYSQLLFVVSSLIYRSKHEDSGSRHPFIPFNPKPHPHAHIVTRAHTIGSVHNAYFLNLMWWSDGTTQTRVELAFNILIRREVRIVRIAMWGRSQLHPVEILIFTAVALPNMRVGWPIIYWLRPWISLPLCRTFRNATMNK